MNDSVTIQDQIKHLKARIVKRTNRLDRLSRRSWKWSLSFHLSLMILSSSITVLAGWEFINEIKIQLASNAILVLGALSTVLSGIIAFLNLDRYRIKTKISFEDMRELRERFRYREHSEIPMSQQELDNFMIEYIRILQSKSSLWKESDQTYRRETQNPFQVSQK